MMNLAPGLSHLPNIWGEGLIFGLSGMDGQTVTSSGFVTTLAKEAGAFLIHTPTPRRLDFRPSGTGTVRIATGEVIQIDFADGTLLFTWAHWHTLVGIVPEPAAIHFGFAEEMKAAPAHAGTSGSSWDRVHRDAVCFLAANGKFALCYGRTLAEAEQRCREAMKIDAVSIGNQRLAYLADLPPVEDPRRRRLLYKCASVMKVNTLSPEGERMRRWSTPDRVPHRHQWLWDTVFHSFGMNHVDARLSREFLCSVLETAWEKEKGQSDTSNLEGMIPFMAKVDGFRGQITQPPILAWGFLENARFLGSDADLEEIIEPLENYLLWNLENRDKNKNHLFEWFVDDDPFCRSGESGLDNSPRFDRETNLDAVDFSVFMAQDIDCLAELCLRAGKESKAGFWRNKARQIESAIHKTLWSKSEGFYYDRKFDGDLLGVKAVTGFLPMLLKDIPSAHVEALLEALSSSDFNTPFPIPSVSVADPAFGNDMWRGPAWVNMNWLVITGLRRQGRPREAGRLAEATLAMIQKYYEESGVLFEFYDSTGRRPPNQCGRKGAIDSEPYLLGKVPGIRDYHWTAALAFHLLVEPRDESPAQRKPSFETALV